MNMLSIRLRPTGPAFAAVAAMAMALAFFSPGGSALAQNSQLQELLNKVERMQTELSTLQRQVYQNPPGAAPAPGGASSKVSSRRATAHLSVRITQLEDALRRLTGQYEEFNYAIGKMQVRLDKLVTDMDYRLGVIEHGGTLSAGQSRVVPPPAPGAAQVAIPEPAPGQRVLGTVPQRMLAGRTPPAGPVEAVLPKGTPKQQYDRAHSLIVKEQNFEEAEKVLRAFITAYPKNNLAANAHYWLGRTYFVRSNFKQAAFTFAEGFQKFPKSDKAPANLLNLGMSLSRLKQTKEACTAYSRLLKRFPEAPSSVTRRTERERRRFKCR